MHSFFLIKTVDFFRRLNRRFGIHKASFSVLNWLNLYFSEMGDNDTLIRRTRSKRYYLMSNGSVREEDNWEVTNYSFVVSQAIEYKKSTGTKPKKKSQRNVQRNVAEPRVTAEIRDMRAKINERSNRATRVYPSIDLDASAVPRPKKIKSKKQLGICLNTHHYSILFCIGY